MLTGHKNWVRQLSGAGDAWEELPTDGTQIMATVPKGETAETVVFRVTAQNSAGWSPVRRPRAQI